MNKGLLIFLGVILLFGGIAISKYNGLIRKDVATEEQWTNVEVAYQRRADLIPNLINTVKGYADFEQETLTRVVESRAKASSINIKADELNEGNFKKFEAAQAELGTSLNKLLLTVERYPDLKANQNFLALQSQLEGTENRIATERKRFNDAVGSYNRTIRSFPSNIIASQMSMEKKPFFESREGSDAVPEVQF